MIVSSISTIGPKILGLTEQVGEQEPGADSVGLGGCGQWGTRAGNEPRVEGT